MRIGKLSIRKRRPKPQPAPVPVVARRFDWWWMPARLKLAAAWSFVVAGLEVSWGSQ